MISSLQQKKSYQWLYHVNCWLTVFFISTFGSLFPLFCADLGIRKTQIGIIFAIMPLSYLITVFVSRWVMEQGPKKIMFRFYLFRYGFILLMPLAIWIGRNYGATAAFIWIASMVFCFAVLRSVAETGWWPWTLELIPSHARGKVDALSSIAANIGAAIASVLAVVIMKYCPVILGYAIVVYVGLFFGLVGSYMISRLPGGEPQIVEKKRWVLAEEFRSAIGNERFVTWMKGMLLNSIATAVFAFLPLFLNEHIGFTADKIMLFSFFFQAGVLASAFFWGWSADRFGSKPVFMNAYMALCLVPIFLLLLPRMEHQSVVVTGGVYALFGVLLQGTIAGTNRYFFVTVLPTTKKPVFCTSINFTLTSVVTAFCSFLYGWLLDALVPFKYDWRFMHVDNFTVLFVIMFICYMGFIFVFRKAPADSGIRTGQFMSFLFEGNPLLAFSSIVRYHLSDDEYSRMEITRRMGDAKSHLTIEELLQAVNDPSYNVRYEAIVSMARMPHDNKLLNALMDVIRSREPGLSEAAAWALGRMRDLRALPVLKEMLKCEYALLRSQCARALANMNDQDSIPEIIAAFGNEHNHNIRAGYAAALGKLCRKEALPDILALLRNLKDERLQGEVALAAARIIGGEHHFVDLWRNSRTDYETACVEELVKIRRRLRYAALHLDKFQSILADCAKKFEQRNLTAGTGDLRAMIAEMLPEDLEQPVGKILEECKNTLSEAGTPRRDYILLALNTLHTAVVSLIHNERKKKLLT